MFTLLSNFPQPDQVSFISYHDDHRVLYWLLPQRKENVHCMVIRCPIVDGIGDQVGIHLWQLLEVLKEEVMMERMVRLFLIIKMRLTECRLECDVQDTLFMTSSEQIYPGTGHPLLMLNQPSPKALRK